MISIKLRKNDEGPAELVIDQPAPPKLRVRLLGRVVGFVDREEEALELPEVAEYRQRYGGSL